MNDAWALVEETSRARLSHPHPMGRFLWCFSRPLPPLQRPLLTATHIEKNQRKEKRKPLRPKKATASKTLSQISFRYGNIQEHA